MPMTGTKTDLLRFHWCSPLDSGQKRAADAYPEGGLNFDGIVDFAKEADRLGVDSLLPSCSSIPPTPSSRRAPGSTS
jgi:alkanesulfonate monooxygenase